MGTIRNSASPSALVMRVYVIFLLFSLGLVGCRRDRDSDETPHGTRASGVELTSPNLGKDTSSKLPHPSPPIEPTLEPLELDVDLSNQWGGLKTEALGHPETAKCIVVLFHGYGAEGDDLIPLATELHAALGRRSETAFILPAAPFVRPAGGRAWFRRDRSNFEEGLEWAQKSIDTLFTKNADARLVIGGFSQGAMLSVNLLRDAPPSLVGAMALSPARYIVREPRGSSFRPPLFLSHGTLDQILPFEGAVQLREGLKKDGFPVTWVEFIGPHAIPTEVRQGMLQFLERHLNDAPGR